MSKLCDRNYTANSLYSTTVIDGVACCPSCNQPAICHGQSAQRRALFWALCGATGMSSEAIARHMTGFNNGSSFRPPSDASDRMRCIKLLELIPEWLPRLKEMVKYDLPEVQSRGIVISSSGISADTNTWSKQIPLIMQEGKF